MAEYNGAAVDLSPGCEARIMFRSVCLLTIVLFLLGILGIIAPMCGAAEAAQDPLEGEWRPIAMTLGKQRLPDELLKETTLAIKNGFYEVTVARKTTDRGRLAYDLKAVPKSIEITGIEGINKGKTILAIYELKDDQLTICYSFAAEKRPEKLETSGDDKTLLAVYKRKK
jgi:uncharacterized protein (TIGR03067 family)